MRQNISRRMFLASAPLIAVGCGGGTDPKAGNGKQSVTIRNVSYDPTREFYQDINTAFAAEWKQKHGQEVTIEQSHGGSGKQARSVIDGLEADVVTLGLAYDIDAIAEKAKLLPADWQSRLPQASCPYTSTIIFLVRKGNPKGIHDWPDLVKAGTAVIAANPKTSGGARWNYLGAWGYALRANKGDEKKAEEFVAKLYKNVPVLDSGARGSTTTFAQRGLGDVLLSWENEAYMALQEFGADKFEIVVPPSSVLAEPPVALVDKIVDRRGTREVSAAYLQFLYSEPGQQIAAKHHFRPRSAAAAALANPKFPEIQFFTIAEIGGDWKKIHERHFADGALFDRLYTPKQ